MSFNPEYISRFPLFLSSSRSSQTPQTHPLILSLSPDSLSHSLLPRLQHSRPNLLATTQYILSGCSDILCTPSRLSTPIPPPPYCSDRLYLLPVRSSNQFLVPFLPSPPDTRKENQTPLSSFVNYARDSYPPVCSAYSLSSVVCLFCLSVPPSSRHLLRLHLFHAIRFQSS